MINNCLNHIWGFFWAAFSVFRSQSFIFGGGFAAAKNKRISAQAGLRASFKNQASLIDKGFLLKKYLSIFRL
ncbi:hypothetical protein CO230_06745 [Chryseobacterium sp. 6424]|uniref:hypothetical protein n=1 Tax=Chryseobacterium sp. 6424 TaxID=2039166 RepID=UPI000EFD42C0|nr:hypothetical protein [Chryseobacterium sp. 6424]AYO57847.1 hypothetical protein CO230_06745 [Chryseobacterium sp. 6424]